MKKKFIIALSFFTFILGFAFMSNNVFAEETQDEQTQEVVKAEEVTISVKLNEFMNKWLTPVTSGALGLLGSFLMYCLTKKRYTLLLSTMTKGVKKTEETRNEANEELQRVKRDYINAKIELANQKENYEKMMIAMKEDAKELKLANDNLTMFKQLVAYLVSSTPELAKNGYAQKILLLLDENKTEITNENVGDDNGTSN